MSAGTVEAPPEYYLALAGVTHLYGRDDVLKREGYGAGDLRKTFSAIKARKQLVILDACQSGAAVESLVLRGVVEEKAILQLARSAGFSLLAATETEQSAPEFAELGHGLFTYALLQALEEK